MQHGQAHDKCTQNFGQETWRKEIAWEDLGTAREIIFNWILEKKKTGMNLWIRFEQCEMAGFCKTVEQNVWLHKSGEFIDQLNNYKTVKEAPTSRS
jgi:hypothetical protein